LLYTINEEARPQGGTNEYTWDQLHAILRRLEDREFVRRISTTPIKWELTGKGRLVIGNII